MASDRGVILVGGAEQSDEAKAPADKSNNQYDDSTLSRASTEFDSVIDRYGQEQAPLLRHRVAAALLNKGIALAESGQSDASMQTYRDLVLRFKHDVEPGIRIIVAQALRNELEQSIDGEDSKTALDICNAIIDGFGHHPGVETCEHVAIAMALKVRLLEDSESPGQALDVCDRLVTDFGQHEDSRIQLCVAVALSRKGVLLGLLDRGDEALAAYNDLVDRLRDTKDPDILQQSAEAALDYIKLLRGIGKDEESLRICDAFLGCSHDVEAPAFLKVYVKILESKRSLVEALQGQDAWKEFNARILECYADSHSPELQTLMIEVLVLKSCSLQEDEARLALLEDVDRRLNTLADSTYLEWLAPSSLEKGRTLELLGRREDAMAAYDDVVRRFGGSKEVQTMEWVARAILAKASVLGALHRWTEVLICCRQILGRIGEFTCTALQRLEAQTWYSRGVALTWLDRPDDARAAYDILFRTFAESTDPKTRCWLDYANAALERL